jgi:Fe-S-cluster containining protein
VDCKQCGKCCTGFWFNNIPLLDGDQEKIVSACKSKEEFQEITDLMDFNDKKMFALKEPCVFLKENKCSIHQNSPSVCKMFPVMIEDTIIINVCCPAGLDLYTKIAIKNNLVLDSIGI